MKNCISKICLLSRSSGYVIPMSVMADAPSVTIRFNERKGNNEKMLNNGISMQVFFFLQLYL